MEYRFQVNLGGIIDLLSNHIYRSPQVFIRELLQNGVDASRDARSQRTESALSASRGRIIMKSSHCCCHGGKCRV
jgi:molecular chaperone HtpG